MAVAVKNKSDAKTSPMLDQLPVSVLMGVVYVLGSLGIVFPLLDYVWWSLLKLDPTSGWMLAGRVFASAAAAGGLVYVGLKLLGKDPLTGVCSGIALTVVTVVVALLLTQSIGTMIESWVYSAAWMGSSGWLSGVVLSAAIGVAFLAGIVWAVFKKQVQRFFILLDEQGWFTLKAYKGKQGAKVRRGTILGLLIIFGTGIYALTTNLVSMGDWKLNIPFTGKVELTKANVGDNPDLKAKVDNAGKEVVLEDRFAVRDSNRAHAGNLIKILSAGSDSTDILPKTDTLKDGTKLEDGLVIPKAEFERIKAERDKKKADHPEQATFIEPPTGEEKVAATQEELKGTTGQGNFLRYSSVTLLPQLRYTAPLILGLLGIWFAWRVVNMPTFGDFLIATEAEINKVSWTTQKRLFQDTVVVLVTVILLTVFLFFADIGWGFLLRTIGVLQEAPKTQEQMNQNW